MFNHNRIQLDGVKHGRRQWKRRAWSEQRKKLKT